MKGMGDEGPLSVRAAKEAIFEDGPLSVRTLLPSMMSRYAAIGDEGPQRMCLLNEGSWDELSLMMSASKLQIYIIT